MNSHQQHHQPPQPPPPASPPPQIITESTTAFQLFKHTTTLFTTHLILFLFLSTLLLLFRSNLIHASMFISSFLDSNPSLRTLLSSLPPPTPPTHHQNHHHRRRPFLHLSRVGTLDDDFFSSDSLLSLFHPSSLPPPNATRLHLQPSAGAADNGLLYPSIILPGLSFKLINTTKSLKNTTRRNLPPRSHFSIKGLEIGRQDATLLLFLVSVLSAAYGYIIIGYIITYTWVHGVVFVKVLDHLLSNYRSTFRTIWVGSVSGLKRLSGFMLMRWAVRDALAQLLGVWYFGEIDNQYVFLKIFIRLKLTPFSDLAPWVVGHETESVGFMVAWLFVEFVVGFVTAVDSWVAIVDSRKSGLEVVKEGWHILATMFYLATKIKFWEAIACGPLMRLVLRKVVGEVFALAFQSMMEVYFMVAWLIFYLTTRHIDAVSVGRPFGRRDLEGFLEGVR